MTEFTTAPPRLTPQQRALAAGVTAVVAATRFPALARGPWDWDEMLFLLAFRDYDVASHHPHPPGFPLYIAAARVFEWLGAEPFRALQLVNLVAAMLIVPAMLLLCGELRLRFEVSLAASALFAFLPNVWFFGGTAFSDVSSIVLAIVACGLLLRGARSSGALIAGAAVLAIAGGFRPQNLLVGLPAVLVACWFSIRGRRVAAVAMAAMAGASIFLGSFAGAVQATGEWEQYWGAVRAHREYLASTDSFRSAIRPGLFQVSDDFFVRPFRFPAMNVVLSFLAAMSAVLAVARRRIPLLLAIALFGPFWILAWLTLDFHSASRFSIGYMPLLAILAADGSWTLVRGSARGMAVAASAMVVALAAWTLPALQTVRGAESPPVRAARFIARTAAPHTTIYVQKRMRPFAEYFLDGFELAHVEESPPPPQEIRLPAVYLREGGSQARGAATFSWPRRALWNIARRRYFDVSVVPLPISP